MRQKHLILIPKAQEQKPSKSKSGKKPDPNKPGVHSFKHGEEDRTVDLLGLQNRCFKFARSKAWSVEDAEDFASWAVVANLNRIDNGNTKNAHLNDVPFLFKDYLVVTYGTHNPNSNRALAHKNTLHYDNKINDDGDTYIDTFEDTSNLNPEEILALKENLASYSEEKIAEINEALRDKKKDRREAKAKTVEMRAIRLDGEDRLYAFLSKKADYLGRVAREPKLLAEKYGTTLHEFNKIISRLENKKQIVITLHWYCLPIVAGEALRIAA